MTDRKGEGIKIIADSYKIIKPLFQVRSYLYAQGKFYHTQSAPSKITMKLTVLL
jgi:hypothetical protein